MRHRFILTGFFLINITATLAQGRISVTDVVKIALENNYDVRIEKTFTDAATTDSHYIPGAFLPQLNAVGSRVNTYNNQELKFQDETRNNKGDVRAVNTSAAVLLNWTLFDGTRMFAARSRVLATEEQSQLLLKERMVTTIATVIENYYNIVRQKQQLKALEEQMAVSEERVKLAERKFQVGTGAKPELLQARVDYNAQRTQALLQGSIIQQLKKQLNGLVDLKLPADFDVTDTIEIKLDLNEADFLNGFEQRNYSLQAARVGIDVAGDALWEQRAQGLPSLTFNAAYNYNKLNNLSQINPFGAIYNLTDGFNAGFTVNIPILNNFNNRRLIQQSKIFSTRQQLVFDQQKVAVNTSLQNAYLNYDIARKILLVEEENIVLAKENVTIALEVFRRGASTFVELRTAQQSLADAYNRLINSRYLAKVAETELLRLNGSLLQ